MARILKLFWRLDFKTSYRYLDNRGDTMKAMIETVPEFWNQVQDGSLLNSYLGQRAVAGEYAMAMSVEQASLNGTIDWRSPRQLDQLGTYEEMRNLNVIIREVLKQFDVKVMLRAGVRPVCTAGAGSSRKSAGEFQKRFFSKSFIEQSEKVGNQEDVGVMVEGVTADAVAYRATFGPLRAKNVKQYLPTIEEDEASLILEDDLFFDIDVYEQQISFVEHSFYRWSETKLAIASMFIDKCLSVSGGKS